MIRFGLGLPGLSGLVHRGSIVSGMYNYTESESYAPGATVGALVIPA